NLFARCDRVGTDTVCARAKNSFQTQRARAPITHTETASAHQAQTSHRRQISNLQSPVSTYELASPCHHSQRSHSHLARQAHARRDVCPARHPTFFARLFGDDGYSPFEYS